MKLCYAYTALVPKDQTQPEAQPTDFRPITVLSAVYRLCGAR